MQHSQFQVHYSFVSDSWRVVYAGRLTTPHFHSRSDAYIYLDMLQKKQREPEFQFPTIKEL